MRFFGISDMLYDQQREWIAGGQDPALIAGNLRRIGLTAGLDGAQVDACLSDPTTAQTLVAWFEENSARDEITSTPSFIINGEKFSNMAYSDFAAVLDERLAAQ
jgi:protein-disulfide isomerase